MHYSTSQNITKQNNNYRTRACTKETTTMMNAASSRWYNDFDKDKDALSVTEVTESSYTESTGHSTCFNSSSEDHHSSSINRREQQPQRPRRSLSCCGKITSEKRQVHFRSFASVHKVMSLNEYTSKQHRKCWYNSDDNKKSEQRRLKVLTRLESGKKESSSVCYRGLYDHTYEGKKQMTQNITRCIRGVLREQRYLQRKMGHSSHDVIDGPSSGRKVVDVDKWDDERIAAISKRFSTRSIQRAIQIAKEDAIDAAHIALEGVVVWDKDVVEDDDEEEKEKAQASPRRSLQIQNSFRLNNERRERRGGKKNSSNNKKTVAATMERPLPPSPRSSLNNHESTQDVSPFAPQRMGSIRKLDVVISDDDNDDDVTRQPPLLPQRSASIRNLEEIISDDVDVEIGKDDDDDGSGGLISTGDGSENTTSSSEKKKKKKQYDCHHRNQMMLKKKPKSMRALLQRSLSIGKMESSSSKKIIGSGSGSRSKSNSISPPTNRRPSLKSPYRSLSFSGRHSYSKLS